MAGAPKDALPTGASEGGAPFYLFHGECDFLIERAVERLCRGLLPPGTESFNLHTFYGGKQATSETTDTGKIIETAQSLPFMSEWRVIVVRRTELYPAAALATLIPYLQDPCPTTCLVFVCAKADFRNKFYTFMRDAGKAIPFKNPAEKDMVPWLMQTAKSLGLKITHRGCAYLYEMVGSHLRDLYNELEKLHVRYGNDQVDEEQVRELGVSSRTYTIFDLVEQISKKRAAESLKVLNRFLEEEPRDGWIRILGMLGRELRLLWQAKSIMEEGGRSPDVAQRLKLQGFVAQKVCERSKRWNDEGLRHALRLLYEADGLMKSGADPLLVLENLVIGFCR
jgi:DNA polymerase-3 subunit delta